MRKRGLFERILLAGYELQYIAIPLWRRLVTILYRDPLMRGRAASSSDAFQVGGLAWVEPGLALHCGDGASLGTGIRIHGADGQFGKVILEKGAAVGDRTQIVAASEIVIEEQVIVSVDCSITDSESWPSAAVASVERALGPQPVRIRRGAWIGNGSYILKGVTVGEGAIIGSGSVVVSDIPDYSLAMGNPAEVYFRNVGKKAAQ